MVTDRIELPPCPECGAAVDDLHVRQEMPMKLRRSDLRPISARAYERKWLAPCGHEVADYDIGPVRGVQRITRLRMVSGFEWRLLIIPTIEDKCPCVDCTLPLGHPISINTIVARGIAHEIKVIDVGDCVCEQQEQPHRHITPHRGIMSHAQWLQCEFPECPCSTPPSRVQPAT